MRNFGVLARFLLYRWFLLVGYGNEQCRGNAGISGDGLIRASDASNRRGYKINQVNQSLGAAALPLCFAAIVYGFSGKRSLFGDAPVYDVWGSGSSVGNPAKLFCLGPHLLNTNKLTIRYNIMKIVDFSYDPLANHRLHVRINGVSLSRKIFKVYRIILKMEPSNATCCSVIQGCSGDSI
jgi:hypothetical protein